MGDGTTTIYNNVFEFWDSALEKSLYYVPNKQNSDEYFVFNADGQHLATRSTLIKTRPLKQFFYDTDFKLLRIENLNGKSTQFVYDANNKLIKIIAPYGQETTFVNTEDHLLMATNSLGFSYEMSYDDLNLLTSFKSVSGVITTFTYAADGALIQESKNNGLLQTLSESINNAVKTIQVAVNWGIAVKTDLISSLSSTIAIRKNNADEVIVTETHNGLITQYEEPKSFMQLSTAPHPVWGQDALITTEVFSHFNRNEAEQAASRSTLTHSYDFKPLTETLPALNSQSTTTRYSAISGNADSISISALNDDFVLTTHSHTETDSTTTYLNAKLQPVRIEIPRRTPIEFSYNDEGQLTKWTKALDFEEYSYDQFGFLNSTKNSKNQITTFERDAQGKVLTKTLPNQDQIKFEYTAAGEIKKIVTPSNQVHNFQMDLGDYLSQYLNPDNKNTSFIYDSDKRLTQIKKPSQKTVNYNYSPTTGNLSSIDTAEGSYAFNDYDPQSRPHSIVSPDNIKIDLAYMGNLTKEQKWSDTDGSPIATLTYQFRGNRFDISTILLNGNPIASLSYDTFGRVSVLNNSYYIYEPDQISINTNEMYTRYWNVETENSNNLLLMNATLNGQAEQLFITMSRTFDGFGQANDYTQTTQNLASGIYNNFTSQLPQYDSNNRLIQTQRNRKTYINSNLVSSTDFQNQYHYSQNSNNNMNEFTQVLVDANHPIRRTTASFSSDDKLLALQGSINRNYTYGPDGNILTMTNCDGIISYEYDSFGNLKKVILPDGKIVEYKVDAMNRRVKKLVNGTPKEYYIWYDQIHLAAILDENKVSKLLYLYGPESNSPSLIVKDGVTYKVLQDPGLGSVRFVVNPITRQIVQEIEYDEFGNIMNNTNPTFQPVLYAGGLYDFDTKLVRFGARDYDPTIGRWTAKDPIDFDGGDTNLYAYVGGNPMSYSDPWGLMKLPADPSGLPDGWWHDTTHKDPTGKRFRYKGGDRYLDFHEGKPDGKRGGNQKKDHWHDPQNDKRHDPRLPGEEVPDPDEPCPKDPKFQIFDPKIPMTIPLIIPFPVLVPI